MATGEADGRWRRFLSGLMLALVASALTLGALEIVVRVFFNQDEVLLLRVPLVGHRFRPSLDEDVYSQSAGRRVHRHFNRLGYRGADWSEAKPAGVHRLAVLGDSFTASTALDENETLPAVLGKDLNQRAPAAHWEALNFGIDGYSPAQSLITWRSYARAYAPDVVIFCLFNGNDISDDDNRLTSYPRPYFHLDANGELVLESLSELSGTFTRWLSEYSALYTWQKRRFGDLRRMRQRQSEAPPGVTRFLDSQPEELIEQSWQLSERILLQMADEVRASGAAFILVEIPDLVQVREADWQDALRLVGESEAAHLQRNYPEERLGRFARAHGITFVPLLEPLSRAAAERNVFLPDGHWNEAGIVAAAEAIVPVIEASGGHRVEGTRGE